MSAIIIPLPGASVVPVKQPRRRGRHPKIVTALWQWRCKRVAVTAAEELEAKARSYRDTAASMRDSIGFALHEAATMEAQARALRGAPR